VDKCARKLYQFNYFQASNIVFTFPSLSGLLNVYNSCELRTIYNRFYVNLLVNLNNNNLKRFEENLTSRKEQRATTKIKNDKTYSSNKWNTEEKYNDKNNNCSILKPERKIQQK
jgi:hypothetical protein